MLNFAQLSATLNLRAVMERVRGAVDEELLGRLQNSGSDRNWDSIEALWRIKNEVRDDAELNAIFRSGDADAIAAAPAGIRARSPPHRRADHALPARVRLARRLEPRVHLPDGPRGTRAGPRPDPRLPRDGLRLPDGDRGDARGHRGCVGRDPRRPRGGRARGHAGRQRDEPPDGAAHAGPPLLHRPGRERPRPARPDGHRAKARRGRPPRPARRRHVPALQRVADAHRRCRAVDAAAIVAERRAERAAATKVHPRNWIGTATTSQLAFPYLVNWGYPERFYQEQSADQRQVSGIAGIAGGRRGHRPGRHDRRRVRRGRRRRHPRLPDDEPGLGRPVHEDRRVGHGYRRDDVPSGRAGPRIRDPRGHRHVGRDAADQRRATGSGSTALPASWRSSLERRCGPGPAGRAQPARRPGHGPAPRANPERRVPARFADRRDAGRPRAQHQPGAGPRGAARAGGARHRRDDAVQGRPRPAPGPARDPRGLRGPVGPRVARRAPRRPAAHAVRPGRTGRLLRCHAGCRGRRRRPRGRRLGRPVPRPDPRDRRQPHAPGRLAIAGAVPAHVHHARRPGRRSAMGGRPAHPDPGRLPRRAGRGGRRPPSRTTSSRRAPTWPTAGRRTTPDPSHGPHDQLRAERR